MRIAAVVLVLSVGVSLAGCPDKKKAAPPPAPPTEGSGVTTDDTRTAPILQPTEQKLDNAMQKNEDRATPTIE